jgi:hypothetical protein
MGKPLEEAGSHLITDCIKAELFAVAAKQCQVGAAERGRAGSSRQKKKILEKSLTKAIIPIIFTILIHFPFLERLERKHCSC